MIYLDHAASTPVDPRVWEAMSRVAAEPLNPSSIHQGGQRARRLLDDARARLVALMELPAGTPLVFTSGATESANLVLRSAAAATPGLRVITSALEHPCVTDTVAALKRAGLAVRRELAVNPLGRAQVPPPDEVDGGLLCLMHANNETGAIQDVAAARAWRDGAGGRRWLADITQTLGKVALGADVAAADWVIASAHKLGGPVGIGLVAGPGVEALAAQVTGGPQEDERRAGTQAVALAVGFAEAVRLAVEERAMRSARLLELERVLLATLAAEDVTPERNGDEPRLPGLLNLSFRGWEAADLAIALDQRGVLVSPGSACSTGVVAVSPVLAAMHPGDPERAVGGLRLSMGATTTADEARRAAAALADIIAGR